MSWTRTMCLITALLAATGCKEAAQSGPAPAAPAQPALLEPMMTEDGLKGHARVAEQGAGELAPSGDARVRARKRLDIDQLDASIRRVTGGIGWTEQRGSTEVNLFEELGESLGKPDFVDSTREDLDPSLIFQKFLADASRSVCTKLVEAERAGRETPHLLIHATLADTPDSAPEKIDANLSALVLRYHGRYLEPDSDRLNAWRFLFRSSWHTGERDTAAAWRAVCVGLMTHPDFYTY